MPAVANDASPGMRHDAKGSLFAMNLGGQTIDQLAELVNWANATDYKSKAITPWVSIENNTATASDASARASAPAPIAASTEPPEQAVAESSGEIAEAVAAETMMAEAAEPIGDEVTVEVAQGLEEIEAAQTVEPAEAIMSPDMIEQVETIAAAQPAEALEAEVSAVTEPPAPKAIKPQAPPVPPPSAPQASAPAVQPRPMQVPPSHSAAEPARGSKAIQPRTIPTMTMPTKMIRQDAGADNQYLHRLESLVLELNLQLARVNNTNIESNADYTHWLSQRVIDLSLENMALQEELAKHKSH